MRRAAEARARARVRRPRQRSRGRTATPEARASVHRGEVLLAARRRATRTLPTRLKPTGSPRVASSSAIASRVRPTSPSSAHAGVPARRARGARGGARPQCVALEDDDVGLPLARQVPGDAAAEDAAADDDDGGAGVWRVGHRAGQARRRGERSAEVTALPRAAGSPSGTPHSLKKVAYRRAVVLSGSDVRKRAGR